MASIIQINGKWRAQVRKKGHPTQTKTFTTKALATRWATAIEAEIERGDFKDTKPLGVTTVGDLLDRYEREVHRMGTAKKESFKVLRAELGAVTLSGLTGARIIEYTKKRGVAPPTWSMELSYLNTVLRVARSLWDLSFLGDPIRDAREAFKMLGVVTTPRERTRRPTTDELTALKAHFNTSGRYQLPMADIVDFAIATAMRAGEIFSITWEDVDTKKKTVIIRDRKDPKRKAGNHQVVPLLPAAWEIIQRQPKPHKGRIFPYIAATISSTFPRACTHLGIKDLRFHDLRHEGTSRLFEMGYGIQEVAIFTGHRSWNQLRRYTQIKPESLHR
ncbi:site-specific integrase [Achromobacter sp. ES-001]|uniref:site-specific integrase n=1 Tax=Achromobacter sp. ES-001 TaxID=2860286 RepID=UPI001C63F187|nr:site-specific integrase [Achromobacter sp. ES-001]QYJ23449.1 site-specific integrase [Achromobacter sp. ES-001]